MNSIKSAIKSLVWAIAGYMARHRIIRPFVFLYSRIIKRAGSQNMDVDISKPTLLALNSVKFSNDLEALSNSGRFRILKMPHEWQKRILSLYWGAGPIDFNRCYNPRADESAAKIQEGLRGFLRIFLPSLYARLRVDCVVGAAVHYVHDYDWGAVSEEIGVPYIVLHKENLMASPKAMETNRNRLKIMGAFRGSHIIVQNDIMRNDVFLSTSYVTPDKISALGCPRMDAFIERIKRPDIPSGDRRKRVTLFSFHHGTGCGQGTGLGIKIPIWSSDGKTGFVKLFEHVHETFARAAIKNPGVDFIIKAKWGGSWPDRIKDVIRKNKMEPEGIGNLEIIFDGEAHGLILQSDVICGFGSTTLLESAIASKPVIIPYFDEAIKPEYEEFILLKGYFHLFDIAQGPAEFEDLITKRLIDPRVDGGTMTERYRIFEKYVSSMKAGASDRYAGLIEKVVKERKGAQG